MKRQLLAIAIVLAIGTGVRGEEITRPMFGMFSVERQDDLRQVLKAIPELELGKIDFETGQVTLKYDLTKLISNANPKKPPRDEQIEQRINDLLNREARGTFRLLPPAKVDFGKLQKLELKVGIHDCKACRYGVYLIVAKMEGVERATVTPKDLILTVWIDGTKVDREQIVAALKKQNVPVLP